MSNERILFVDDDPNILKGIARQLGDDFDLSTALGPIEALKILENDEPFAVVVSDMRMPEMNGTQLLKKIRESSPNTVRMILTGFAELKTTIEAVNEGHIFRFLAKPCDDEVMASALRAGLRQYQLQESERELVEGTLHGCVKVLSDVLSLVSPIAFGKSTRVRSIVDAILERIKIQDPWKLEIAAMLSSLGCLVLPEELLLKKFKGEELDASEMAQFDKHPEVASELIRSVPRLEDVSEIIASQSKDLKKTVPASILRHAMILEMALAFDFHESNGLSPLHALEALKSESVYDSELLAALQGFVNSEKRFHTIEIDVKELEQGMVVADNVHNSDGTLLISKGQMITPSALRLLQNMSSHKSLDGPIKIYATCDDVALC